jgi:D-amino-acid dehydrogenase
VLCDMGFKSLAIWEQMMREESIECDYARDGWLDVVMQPENMDAAEAEAKALVPYGYSYQRLTGDELRARDPIFRDEIAGAIHYTDSAHAHPGDFLMGLARACATRGANVRTDATVTGFLRSAHGRVAGVKLRDGSMIESDAVVLAAGIWNSDLARSLGLHVPMVGARGYHMQFRHLPTMPSTGMVLHETFIAVTPMRNELRIAGTLEIDRLGQPWRRERLAMLTKGAERYLHGLDQAKPVAEWAGYRPCARDGMPVLGFAPKVGGVLIAGAHAMMGMTFGPVTGEAAAAMLCGEKPSFDVSMLRADRF